MHLNVQFDEPLVESEKTDWLAGLKILSLDNENKIDGKLERVKIGDFIDHRIENAEKEKGKNHWAGHWDLCGGAFA